MTHAPAHRAFHDPDSHIMELPDFLEKFSDPDPRDEIPEVSDTSFTPKTSRAFFPQSA